MYIWVILATFVVALFSYNLSVRSDSRDLYVTPQAQAVVSKLLIQHEAVTKYVKTQYDLAKKGTEETMFLGPVDLKITVNPDTNKEEGILTKTVLGGFRPEAGEVTKLYCINSRDINKKVAYGEAAPGGMNSDIKSCTGSTETNAKNEDGTDKVDANGNWILEKNYARLYVVTTMPIPVRWRARGANGSTINAPNADLIKAIKKNSTQGVNVGYVVAKDKYTNQNQAIDEKLYKDSSGVALKVNDFDYFISGFQDKLVPIPNAISANGLFGTGENDCKVGGNEDSDKDKGSSNCLIVMSVVR